LGSSGTGGVWRLPGYISTVATDRPAPAVPPSVAERLRGRRLWVSGGRGFIGRRVAALAAQAGAQIVLFPGDVREGVADHITASAPDLLIHLAAPVNVARDPSLTEEMQSVIVGGARAVRAGADSLARAAQLVLVGTCEEYGTIAAPFHEDDAPSAPVSPYAAAKLQATREALSAPRSHRLVIARPFLTYGPGQAARQLVPAAVRAAVRGERFAMTRGLQTREFNFVDDVARGLLAAATTPAANGLVVNIGGGEERPIIDLVRRIFTIAGADPGLIDAGALPDRPGEIPRFYADTERARRVLGHRPRVGLDDGLARTIAAEERDEG